MRTQGRLDCDTPYGDGQIFVSALDGTFSTGTGTVSRTGSGLLAYSVAAAAVLMIPVSTILLRYGTQDWLQEQFGSAQAGGAQGLVPNGYTANVTTLSGTGSNVNVPVGSSLGFTVGRAVSAGVAGVQKTIITAIPDATHITLANVTVALAVGSTITESLFTTPAGVTGTPPYTGSSQLTPVTSPRPKGIAIKAINPVYTVTGTAATVNTIGLTKTVFANITAPVVTNIIANAANGLQTAVSATPYLTPINIAQPVIFQNTKFSELLIEWDITPGTTALLYGVFLDVVYNFN